MLIVSTFLRMLLPKVLQITIDGVVLFFVEGKPADGIEKDPVAAKIYNILPEITLDNLGYILILLGLIYLIIAGLRSGLQVVSAAITASSTEKAIKQLRDYLFVHIQRLPISFIHKNSTGEMIQRCTGDVETVRRFIMNQVVDILRFIAVFVFAFSMMFVVNKTYALIAIILSPAICITTYFFFKKEGKVWAEHEDEADKLTTMVNENLNGIRVVKAFANESYEIERFDEQNKAKRKVGLKQVWLHGKFWPFSDLMVHLQVAVSIFYGGYLALKGIITVGEYSAFFTYGIMVTWPMQQLGRTTSQMGMAVVAMERLSHILDAEEEDYTGKILEKALQGNIEFKNVSFTYPQSQTKVLDDVSFKINAGEEVALIGPTGSGKSTIITLLTRFYEPDEGEILLDGIPINQLSKAYLRDKIGVVLQKPFLFSTTINKNIAYAVPEVTEKTITDVAKAASIHEIEHIFADGYQTMVGEKGVTLSGGQKQRVALARTLLENPEILVLDDATSAVDTETEFKIQNALNEKLTGKTAIVIAHRATSVQNADRVIVLEKGKVVQYGLPNKLANEEGFYKMMLELQTKVEEDFLN